MKRKISVLLSLFILCYATVACAYKFPQAFWGLNDKYQAAVEAGDHNGIIKYGTEVIELMEGEPECEETINVLADRYQRVAGSYAEVGKYGQSAWTFQKFLPYAEKVGWDDSVIIANAKISQYREITRIFTSGGQNTYFGAKNEKENGVLFGVCSNGGIRQRLGNESMVLVYQETCEALSGYNKKVISEAAMEGIAVEYALNCRNEAADIANVKSINLQEISDMFAQYPNLKVYLRFGAEFNVWQNRPEPQAYIDAFKYVADFFHTRNSNVAMVWSPNQVSEWGLDVHSYYPGDEYVDWLGVSLYSQPYFGGDNTIDNDYTELVFRTGDGADPILALEELTARYNKPVMLSESGFAHTITSRNEDTTEWALQKMNELYSYVPMVYPQVKLIAHFDHYIAPEVNDFRLSNKSVMADTYIEKTKAPRFIQDKWDNTSTFNYRELNEGTTLSNICDLYCYSHLFGEDIKSVTYYIDDVHVGTSEKMPFACYVDLRQFENGSHTLEVRAIGGTTGRPTSRILSSINIQNTADDGISVVMDGNALSFDQPPVIYNGRTMVPMRAIFDAMGAEISWDDSTKTVVGKKDGTQVSIAVGSNILTVNGKDVTLDVPAILLSGRTLVPARAIAESFSCTVGWDGTTKTVQITK